MSNFSRKPRLWTAIGVTVPLAIFFAARSVASWRPQRIGVQPLEVPSSEQSSHFLNLSSDEKWLVSSNMSDGTGFIWNLSANSKRKLEGGEPTFSNDSRLLATVLNRYVKRDSSDVLVVQRPEGGIVWKRRMMQGEQLMNFIGDKEIYTNTDYLRFCFDSQTGKQLCTLPPETSRWKEIRQSRTNGATSSKISYFAVGASKPTYSFTTSSPYDSHIPSPDEQQMWVALCAPKRFDILDAQTGKRLWFYTSNDWDSGEFTCFASWEDGGKSLATIENDTLILRDARTGKVLLSHKNNLPAPLKSWAFTKDKSAVYLMNNRGEIFRQRLR